MTSNPGERKSEPVSTSEVNSDRSKRRLNKAPRQFYFAAMGVKAANNRTVSVLTMLLGQALFRHLSRNLPPSLLDRLVRHGSETIEETETGTTENYVLMHKYPQDIDLMCYRGDAKVDSGEIAKQIQSFTAQWNTTPIELPYVIAGLGAPPDIGYTDDFKVHSSNIRHKQMTAVLNLSVTPQNLRALLDSLDMPLDPVSQQVIDGLVENGKFRKEVVEAINADYTQAVKETQPDFHIFAKDTFMATEDRIPLALFMETRFQQPPPLEIPVNATLDPVRRNPGADDKDDDNCEPIRIGTHSIKRVNPVHDFCEKFLFLVESIDELMDAGEVSPKKRVKLAKLATSLLDFNQRLARLYYGFREGFGSNEDIMQFLTIAAAMHVVMREQFYAAPSAAAYFSPLQKLARAIEVERLVQGGNILLEDNVVQSSDTTATQKSDVIQKKALLEGFHHYADQSYFYLPEKTANGNVERELDSAISSFKKFCSCLNKLEELHSNFYIQAHRDKSIDAAALEKMLSTEAKDLNNMQMKKWHPGGVYIMAYCLPAAAGGDDVAPCEPLSLRWHYLDRDKEGMDYTTCRSNIHDIMNEMIGPQSTERGRHWLEAIRSNIEANIREADAMAKLRAQSKAKSTPAM